MKNIHQFNKFSAVESKEKRLVFAVGGGEKPQEAVPMPKKPGEEKDNAMDMVKGTKDSGVKAIESAYKTKEKWATAIEQGEDKQKLKEKVDAAFNAGRNAKQGATPSEIGSLIMEGIRKLSTSEMQALVDSGSGTDGTIKTEKIRGNVYKLISDGRGLRMENVPENMYQG